MEEKEQEIVTMTDPKAGESSHGYAMHNTGAKKVEPQSSDDLKTPQDEARDWIANQKRHEDRLLVAMNDAIVHRR